MSNDDPVTVHVDDELCIGVGQCEMLEPLVFRVDDDKGFASILPGATLARARAQATVDKCPSRAISIRDAR